MKGVIVLAALLALVAAQDVNTIPSSFPAHPVPHVSFTNRTTSLGSKASTISLSVEEITAWLQSGGTNPLEAGLLKLVNDYVNAAGISLDGGSLVYRFNNGQQIILDGEGQCSDLTLMGGWTAQASLKPGFRVTFSFGLDKGALEISSSIRAETDFAMHCDVKYRSGFRVFGACVRPIVKTANLDVGAYMILQILSYLEVRLTSSYENGAAVLGLKPTYCLKGKMESFIPTTKASITIFGIHLTGIERKIETAIREDLSKAFSQETINTSFKPANDAIQAALNDLLGNTKIVIPGMPQDMYDALNCAISIINWQQNYICSNGLPPWDGHSRRPPPRPTCGQPAPEPRPDPRPTPVPQPDPHRRGT